MTSGENSGLVTIGRVLKPRGLKGELRIRPLAEFPENPPDDLEVYVKHEVHGTVTVRVERISVSGHDLILKLVGVDDRSSAEALYGAEISMSAENLEPLPVGSFYPFELIGAEVADESGVVLGTLVRIESYPAQDVLVIATETSAFMAPAARDFFVSFDRNERRLVLRLPEGLPEYAGEI